MAIRKLVAKCYFCLKNCGYLSLCPGCHRSVCSFCDKRPSHMAYELHRVKDHLVTPTGYAP